MSFSCVFVLLPDFFSSPGVFRWLGVAWCDFLLTMLGFRVKTERLAVYLKVQDAAEDRLGTESSVAESKRRTCVRGRFRTSATRTGAERPSCISGPRNALSSPVSRGSLLRIWLPCSSLCAGISFATCRAITVCMTPAATFSFFLYFLYSFLHLHRVEERHGREHEMGVCFYVFLYLDDLIDGLG